MTTHGSVAKSMRGRIEKLTDERDALRAEVERLRGNYEGACQTIARMHEAAMGEVCGPNRGVVEDVADLRAEVESWKRNVDITGAELKDALAEVERIGAALKMAEPNQDVREAIYDNVDLLNRAEKAEAALGRIDSRARIGQDSTPVAALAALASIRKTIAALRDTAPAEEKP
jgi:hypothetical protein